MLRKGIAGEAQCAWPVDALTVCGRFVGFVMPRVMGKCKMREIYSFSPKRAARPWSLYIAIARNLSAAVYSVHSKGQVIGDLNPDNIMVDPDNGMVTLVDTDSYHIDDSGIVYRCNVGMPEFVAPELQGKEFKKAPLPTFTKKTDSFSLAILIFALLMNGSHPFACRTRSGSASSFQPIDNIRKGLTPFFEDSKGANIGITIPAYAPGMACLPDDIRDLFHRAFVDGYGNPGRRPGADEWYHALEKLEKRLTKCSANSRHLYYSGSRTCPWCEVERKMNKAVSNDFVAVKPRTGTTTAGSSATRSANSGSGSGSYSHSGSAPRNSGSSLATNLPGRRRCRRRSLGSSALDVLENILWGIFDVICFVFGGLKELFRILFIIISELFPVILKPLCVILVFGFMLFACSRGYIISNISGHIESRAAEKDGITTSEELNECYELSLASYTCIRADEGAHGRIAPITLNTGEEAAEYLYASAPYSAIYWDVNGNFDHLTGIWAVRQTERDTETLNDFDIIADGERIYSSPSIKGGDIPVEVSVDISGCRVLAIMFKSGRGEAVLADVMLSNDEPRKAGAPSGTGLFLPEWLTDREPIFASPAINIASDANGRALDGATYSHYLFSYDKNEKIVYNLGGKYDRLTGIWTICRSDSDTDIPNSFELYADDRLIYSSPVISGEDASVFVDARLDECELLTVRFTEGTGQGEFGNIQIYPSENPSSTTHTLLHPGEDDLELIRTEYFSKEGFVVCKYSEDMNTGENAAYFIAGDEGDSIEYYLDGKFSEFAGTWTIKQFSRDTCLGYSFDICADGKKIYSSPVITGGMLPERFNVDVSGCRVMRIEITSGGDGAMIAEPFLVYE